MCSGVTRVGVTRGGSWWVSPIFSGRNLTTFLGIASESDDLFSCRLLTTPIFPRRLSSVLSKFSHEKLILGWVSPGAVRPLPPSDATACVPCAAWIKITYIPVFFCVDCVIETDQEGDISGWVISKRIVLIRDYPLRSNTTVDNRSYCDSPFSGVTRVGVIWGGNWWVSLCFFLEKIWRPFLVIASPHHSHLPTSFIQCSFRNSATKIAFRSGVTPRRVSPGAVPLVTPLALFTIWATSMQRLCSRRRSTKSRWNRWKLENIGWVDSRHTLTERGGCHGGRGKQWREMGREDNEMYA